MTVFVLKMIAVMTMIIDHIKYAVPFTRNFITQYFGRISFPIFAFLIAEGMVHTKSRKKYACRMFIFALISQIPFMLFRQNLVEDAFMLNIMFTFFIAIIGIMIFEFFSKLENIPKVLNFIMTFLVAGAFLYLGLITPVDYSWYGIATVWVFYILRDKKILRTVDYILLVALYYISRYFPYLMNIDLISLAFAILPVFIILFYNGKEGKKLKYFFYVFYPLHLLVFYGLSFIF